MKLKFPPLSLILGCEGFPWLRKDNGLEEMSRRPASPVFKNSQNGARGDPLLCGHSQAAFLHVPPACRWRSQVSPGKVAAVYALMVFSGLGLVISFCAL